MRDEPWIEAVEAARVRLETKDYDSSDIRDAFFCVPFKHWDQLEDAISREDKCAMGRILWDILVDGFAEQEYGKR